MNQGHYRLVYNTVRRLWQVAGEFAKRCVKSGGNESGVSGGGASRFQGRLRGLSLALNTKALS